MFKHLFLTLILIVSFICSLNGQTNRAQALFDSIITLKSIPPNESLLPILNRLKRLSEIEKDSFLLGQSLFGICNTYLGSKDYPNYEIALNEYFEYSKDTASIGLIHYSNALGSKALLANIKGNNRKSIEYDLEAIEYEQSIGSRPLELSLLYHNLSSHYRLVGDYSQAYISAKLALENTEKREFTDESQRIFKLADGNYVIGLTFLYKSKFDVAASYFQKSIFLLDKYDVLEKLKVKKLRIEVLLRYGACLLKNGELKKVKSIFTEVEEIQKTIEFRKFKLDELKSEYYILKKDFSKAHALLELALIDATRTFKGTKLFSVTSRINNRIADVQSILGLKEEALMSCQNGLKYFDDELTNDLFSNPVITDVSFAPQTLEVLLNKASIANSLYSEKGKLEHYKIANNAYKEGIKVIDLMRNSYLDSESKFYVTGTAVNLYNDYLDLLSNFNEDDTAVSRSLEVMSRTKSINLTEEIKSRRSLLKSKIPKENLDEIELLKTNITFYSKKIAELSPSDTAITSSKVLTLQKELDSAKSSYSILINRLERLFPDYFSQHQNLTIHTDLKQIQEKLSNNELLLDYYVGKEDLFIMAISSERALFEKVNFDFSNELLDFINFISEEPDESGVSSKRGEYLAQLLFGKLFNPLKDMLNGKEQLIVIPHNKLNSLSFDALRDIGEVPDYLINKFSIRYLYSTQQLFEEAGSLVKGNSYLIEPHFHASADLRRSCNAEPLGDLQFASKEVDHIEKLLESTRLSGDAASVSNFVKDVSNYPIIHLATHACLNESDPMLSEIFFSDGSLTNYDLQNLNINPELVVLAACNTAQGAIQKGEGVISLSRGFFEAGVKSLVSSLWSIDDFSSSQIIKGMYDHLADGKPKAQAIRQAKLDYLESGDKLRSHPYYWAGLVQIGDGSPIASNFGSKTILLLLGTFLLLALLVLLFKRTKKIS